MRGEGLVYVGGCVAGWSRQESMKLRELLEEIVTKSPAVSLNRKGAVFVDPVLVAEVEYRTWTDDGKLWHPSLKGIRDRASRFARREKPEARGASGLLLGGASIPNPSWVHL